MQLVTSGHACLCFINNVYESKAEQQVLWQASTQCACLLVITCAWSASTLYVYFQCLRSSQLLSLQGVRACACLVLPLHDDRPVHARIDHCILTDKVSGASSEMFDTLVAGARPAEASKHRQCLIMVL